ncbi:MAG TPA: DUF1540 domain-containing protein [Bacillota bacterium]|jgi:hypothetical protein|nr:DUF1540 domain-containing protein [Bacillota bacterium]HOB87769.1 DUF1540 domain-containing protein [Bacillota bacterium]HOP69408.1 DUF1540 domain-containing protein [Bacillota bacterium]HPT34386.1 DUF1540 domain-containing protein [Bacillota bacterium]HPZ65347.1 DUF1540 domain-containing protein [Bacillota bacterium]
MAAIKVKCSVSNCHYWKDMYCVAEDIEVNCQDGGMEAESSENTCCDTFEPMENE